jgi:expansin (peptidoglycan-binding protein)
MSWGARRKAVGIAAVGIVAAAVTVVGGGGVASGSTRSVGEVMPGDGMATHYDSDGTGNCSLPALPGEHLDVALPEVEYGTADSCGGWLDVTGPNGSVRVVITNRCPECQQGHLDLSKEAFARIAPLEQGQVDISYSLVRNPPLAEPMSIKVKDGSSQWWMEVQPVNHGNPIARFELQQDGAWRSLVHTQDNFWRADPGPGVGPYTFRITDIYGQTATVEGITMSPEVVQPTSARLYGAGSVPPATTAPPTTTTKVPPTTTSTSTTTTSTTTTTTTTVPPSTAALRPEQASSTGPGGGGGLGASTVVVVVLTVAANAGGAFFTRRRFRSDAAATAAGEWPSG